MREERTQQALSRLLVSLRLPNKILLIEPVNSVSHIKKSESSGNKRKPT